MASSPVRRPHELAIKESRHVIPHAAFFVGELVMAALVAVMSFVVKRHPGPLPGDPGLELDVQNALLPHRSLSAAIEALSTLNWPVPAAITLGVIAVLFLLLRRWLDVIVSLLTAAVASESNYLLSQVVKRPRPSGHGIHVLSVVKTTYSFPSGHMVWAVAVFGLFLYLSAQVRRPFHPALVWGIRVVVAAIILLMPVSRILEGQHWPSDVFGGALFGAFWLVLAAHLYIWLRGRWPVLLARDEQ